VSRILSLDPAEKITGYAVQDVIESDRKISISLQVCDLFASEDMTPKPRRKKGDPPHPPRDKVAGLVRVRTAILNLIQIYRPQQVIMEVEPPIMQVGAVWRKRTDGVIIEACGEFGLTPSEVLPNEMGSFFLGGGVAKGMKREERKPAVQELVRSLYQIEKQTEDASDAVALGVLQAMCFSCPQRDACKVRTTGLANLVKNGCPRYDTIEIGG
jgi:Holliday junction resolvasome RuvABC endonuclease subunit